MIYLQSKSGKDLHTCREFSCDIEAKFWLKEFCQCFPYRKFYLSSRPCKNWKTDKIMIAALEGELDASVYSQK